jgi:hypothetical protein
MPPKRILVAGPMKCGSTYVAEWLALYFGLERCNPLDYWGRQEQNLDAATMDSLKRASFVLQLHSKPYVPLIRWLTLAQVHLVFLWRNIADALVSLDEHIRSEDHRVPACYIHDQVKYSSLSSEERYAFLIQHAGPWYIQFYLMWKQADATLSILTAHYEQLLSSPAQFFERLISDLAGSVDHNCLATLIDKRLENTRFNQGLSGRSRRLFSKRNKWELEHLLREHPEDLSALVNELPWRGNRWDSDVFHYKEYGTSTDLLVSNELAHAPVGMIGEAALVRQTFCCRRPGLNTIELWCATYGRRIPSGVIRVRLEQGGRVLRQSEVALSSVKDNSWVQITFLPITDSAGREFDLIVSVAGAPEGCSFTIWASDFNPHRGTLRFAGGLHNGALCMRTGCIAP